MTITDRTERIICWVIGILAVLFLLWSATGCNPNKLIINKTVIAFPGAIVEMNSETQADGNTNTPTVSTQAEAKIPLVP